MRAIYLILLVTLPFVLSQDYQVPDLEYSNDQPTCDNINSLIAATSADITRLTNYVTGTLPDRISKLNDVYASVKKTCGIIQSKRPSLIQTCNLITENFNTLEELSHQVKSIARSVDFNKEGPKMFRSLVHLSMNSVAPSDLCNEVFESIVDLNNYLKFLVPAITETYIDGILTDRLKTLQSFNAKCVAAACDNNGKDSDHTEEEADDTVDHTEEDNKTDGHTEEDNKTDDHTEEDNKTDDHTEEDNKTDDHTEEDNKTDDHTEEDNKTDDHTEEDNKTDDHTEEDNKTDDHTEEDNKTDDHTEEDNKTDNHTEEDNKTDDHTEEDNKTDNHTEEDNKTVDPVEEDSHEGSVIDEETDSGNLEEETNNDVVTDDETDVEEVEVDKSDIEEDSADADGYIFHPTLDSRGGDITLLKGYSVKDLKKWCTANANCLGFNSKGEVKSRLTTKDAFVQWTSDPTLGLYLKKTIHVDTYTFYPYQDSKNYDITRLKAQSVESLKAYCSSRSDCNGFNTEGYIKKSIRPMNQWKKETCSANVGLYVKQKFILKPYNYDFYSQLDSKGNDIHQLVKSYDVEDLKRICDLNPSCKGFNTEGWIKKAVKAPKQFNKHASPVNFGMFVKGTVNTKASYALENYAFYPSLDSNGNDMIQLKGKSIDEMKAYCDSHPQCQGFNTDGYMKKAINSFSKLVKKTSTSNFGLYIKGGVSTQVNDYTFWANKDSNGNDMIQLSGGYSVEDLKLLCDANPACKGFNTLGYLKSVIKPWTQFNKKSNPVNFGLYVKN